MSTSAQKTKIITAAVIVASLGYFVDIFDLLIFSIVRKNSLASLGLDEAGQISQGLFLHNLQMVGMLIGGVMWGVFADKKGRLSVLFGSIALYSLGNIANGFVQTVNQYALCRFISGLGLAGELGAGITLVAESLPKDKRGYGTAIVATVGVSGAVFAGLVYELFDWRKTYIIGGVLGLALLLLRINTAESLLFQHGNTHTAKKGDFLSLFTNWDRFKRFLYCILVGVPIWFVVGTLVQLSPEFSKELGIQGEVTAARAVMVSYAGLIFGDLFSGLLSQLIRSRTKVLTMFLIGLAITITIYLKVSPGFDAFLFYLLCSVMGFFAGYWAIFVTVSAEQFGTNLRGTVATSSPNFVRASVVPISLSFQALRPSVGMVHSASIIGLVVIVLALLANWRLKDTFHKDLHFFEVD